MGVVSASGNYFKPIADISGKQAHNRGHSDGISMTVLNFLPSCYVYHCDHAGVGSLIFDN